MDDFLIPQNKIDLDLFPVPFRVINFGEKSRKFNSRLLSLLFAYKEEHPVTVNKLNNGIWQNIDPLDSFDPFFEYAKEVFFEATKPFIRRCGVQGDLDEQFKVEGLFGNVTQSAHAVFLPHHHGKGNSSFVGVYYPSSGIENDVHLSHNQNLDDDPNIYAGSNPLPGDIQFIDPALIAKRQVYNNNYNRYPYYGLEMCVTPREGLLIVFPHYLSHLVMPTGNDNFTRVSIVFDILIKR